LSDDQYPYFPSKVVEEIKKKIEYKIKIYNHTLAWKKYKGRPNNCSKNPSQTKRDFCIYHKVNKNYSYNKAWVEFLIKEFSSV